MTESNQRARYQQPYGIDLAQIEAVGADLAWSPKKKQGSNSRLQDYRRDCAFRSTYRVKTTYISLREHAHGARVFTVTTTSTPRPRPAAAAAAAAAAATTEGYLNVEKSRISLSISSALHEGITPHTFTVERQAERRGREG